MTFWESACGKCGELYEESQCNASPRARPALDSGLWTAAVGLYSVQRPASRPQLLETSMCDAEYTRVRSLPHLLPYLARTLSCFVTLANGPGSNTSNLSTPLARLPDRRLTSRPVTSPQLRLGCNASDGPSTAAQRRRLQLLLLAHRRSSVLHSRAALHFSSSSLTLGLHHTSSVDRLSSCICHLPLAPHTSS